MNHPIKINRRHFIRDSALLTAGISTLPFLEAPAASPSDMKDSIYIIGPQKGYTPQIGTLLSTMTMMRAWVIDTVKDLSVAQLDYQMDDQSNSIGAMLYHLAATEKYYQLNTFENMKWGSWSKKEKEVWDVPMNLGEEARETIVGNELDFYLEILAEVRATTQAEFAKRNDSWLQKTEPFFENLPTNNYCKWFHVCEHESNHRGQMKLVISRLPA